MKKLNIKALFVNHIEKIVFGLFALIVLGVLAGGTSWARYAKTPDELKRDVENAKQKITSNNPWPKDKEESFKVIDFSEKARMLFTMPLVSRYDFSQWLFHPLYKKDEPKREPTYEAVQNLIANATFVPLSVLSEEARKLRAESSSAAEGTEDSMPAESVGNDEFEARTASTGAGRGRFPGGDGAMTPPGAMGPGYVPPGASTKGAGGHGAPPGAKAAGGHAAPKSSSSGSKKGPAMPGGGHGAPGLLGMPGMEGTGMMPGMMTGMTSDVSARGVRVMAVRGVFPIQKQIENYRNALHVTQDEAAELLEITDFILERQVALPGADPWKESPWVVVNIESALEVLNECSDLDFEDPVPQALRDAAITMDLPLNLLGVWRSFATHPLIKNEELSLEAIEEEAKLLEKASEVAEAANLQESGSTKKKGLARNQRDFKSIVNQVTSNSDSRGMMEQMMKQMKSAQAPSDGPRVGHGAMPGMGMTGMGMPGMPGMGMPGMRPGPGGGGMRGLSALDRLVARRKYLLFRYFDFDVEFGMAYRYRVRLELKNPNFERPADELGDIEIAKGEFRLTPWSNTSNPDVVRNKAGYFLKDVEREPYHEDKVKPSSRPVALISMYEWDTTMGTVFSDILNLTSIGGYIGEKKEKGTLIPDLVAGTLEKGEHTFATQDALVDVESDFDLSPEQHPDLSFTAEKGRATVRLGLMEEALVVVSNGELKAIGQPLDDFDKEALRQWKQREDLEHKIIKSKETQPVMGSMAATGDEPGQPRVNPRRRGRGRGAAMTNNQMPGMGMPPGTGMPPGMGPAGAGGSSNSKKSARQSGRGG